MMGSVAVGSTMAMNSFSDHKFLVYPAGGWTVLKELTIFADRADYWLEFDLEDADDGSASSVSHSAALSSPGKGPGNWSCERSGKTTACCGRSAPPWRSSSGTSAADRSSCGTTTGAPACGRP